jgi:hypothetical protein
MFWGKKKKQQKVNKPGTVAHACNPRYLRGGNRKDYSSRPAHVKSQ